MQKLKKRFIVPVVVFILGMCALIGAIRYICSRRESGTAEQDKCKAQCDDIYGAYIWRAYGGNRSYR